MFFSVLGAYKAAKGMKVALENVGFNMPNGVEDYEKLKITSLMQCKSEVERRNEFHELSMQWMDRGADHVAYFGDGENQMQCLGFTTLHQQFHVQVHTNDDTSEWVQCLSVKQAVHVLKAHQGSDAETLEKLFLCKTAEEIDDVCADIVVSDVETWYNSIRTVTRKITAALTSQREEVRDILLSCKGKQWDMLAKI